MRRTRQPKRPIVSEKQAQHRQTYRQALAWRKSLSLPNRRFLEGYCLSNWVVDRYKMPLPWHRFALKIYLEHIHFVLITKPLPSQEQQDPLYEHYNTGDDNQAIAYWLVYLAQTFTPLVSHHISHVVLKLYRAAFPHTITVSLTATDDEGHPTGDDLCSGTTDGDTLPTEPPGEWREITLGDGYNLQPNVKYAIIVAAPDFGPGSTLYWRYDSTGTYPRGNYEETPDGGVTWNAYVARDFMFEEHSAPPPIPPVEGLLHIRHPAIKSFSQRRNGIIIRAEDNLSSLDDQYLTKQVGLDVQQADEIEATTVAGILYKHLV